MKIKKIVYIILFAVLGVLLQFMVHGAIEVWAIKLLVGNFETFGLGLSWEAWFLIHHIGTALLLMGGIIFGWWQGVYWWGRIYEKQSN